MQARGGRRLRRTDLVLRREYPWRTQKKLGATRHEDKRLIDLAPRAGDEVGGYLIDIAIFYRGCERRYQQIYQHDLASREALTEIGISASACSHARALSCARHRLGLRSTAAPLVAAPASLVRYFGGAGGDFGAPAKQRVSGSLLRTASPSCDGSKSRHFEFCGRFWSKSRHCRAGP